MLSEGSVSLLASLTATRLRSRNPVTRAYFAREAPRLAQACRAMAERFQRGGRLYAFGRGAYATDAAHVSVEFVHPVIVGKRALPALDVSAASGAWVDALIGSDDMALAFGPPEGDAELLAVLERARRAGALTFALPGTDADFPFAAPSTDAHVHQEIFELLGHTLYESVHVFFEHRSLGHQIGASAFLYPYLGTEKQDTEGILADVTASILAKVNVCERLREQVAAGQAEAIARATCAIGKRIAGGGRILAFGNGGSATDATDFAIDCVQPPPGLRAVPALSLACEPAVLSAIGNDVGIEVIFLRQIIAQARPQDVAFAFSTSGGSKNVIAALEEARKRGLLTVALLGYDGGEIVRRGLADHAIVVSCQEIPRIQEAQGSIYHVMREGLGALADGT
jgi:D-sedoheptulose 7-phosphate isomerase